MIDPRLTVVKKRLHGISRIIAVTGWKGGIGKSSVACALALVLAETGKKTGLLDLDFSGASDHIILGAPISFPSETKGIDPVLISGVKFMTPAFFSKNEPAPLRGDDMTSAMLELLAVTNWGELDFLIIDTPPGIGDTALNLTRWIPRAELLVITSPSALAREIAARSVKMFREMNIRITAVVENENRGAPPLPAGEMLPSATIGFDPAWETACGNSTRILASSFAKDIRQLAQKLI